VSLFNRVKALKTKVKIKISLTIYKGEKNVKYYY